MATRQITRPVLNYFGGKFRLAPWIVDHFPPHATYVEPFCGAASVLLCKPPAGREIINDLDHDIVNLFRVLRDPRRAAALKRRLELTAYAREEFNLAYEGTADPVEKARRTVVRSYLGFSNVGVMRRTGFKTRGRPATTFASWPAVVGALTKRLRGVIIENRPAIDVMRSADGPTSLHYVDPPYVLGARSCHARTYRHELSDRDHEELLDVLSSLSGTVVLSGYPSEIYEARLARWRRIERPARNGAAGQACECLWIKEGG